ncbi:hypothetical protein HD554DRAFT_24891 [Boletus coccyginus]|nr:hypothetical protein HD554DRAFT_24891 [Boletus coccyginus]
MIRRFLTPHPPSPIHTPSHPGSWLPPLLLLEAPCLARLLSRLSPLSRRCYLVFPSRRTNPSCFIVEAPQAPLLSAQEPYSPGVDGSSLNGPGRLAVGVVVSPLTRTFAGSKPQARTVSPLRLYSYCTGLTWSGPDPRRGAPDGRASRGSAQDPLPRTQTLSCPLPRARTAHMLLSLQYLAPSLVMPQGVQVGLAYPTTYASKTRREPSPSASSLAPGRINSTTPTLSPLLAPMRLGAHAGTHTDPHPITYASKRAPSAPLLMAYQWHLRECTNAHRPVSSHHLHVKAYHECTPRASTSSPAAHTSGPAAPPLTRVLAPSESPSLTHPAVARAHDHARPT